MQQSPLKRAASARQLLETTSLRTSLTVNTTYRKMSDVADMLGIAGKATTSVTDEALKIMGDKAKTTSGKPAKKPKGMSREVYDLLGKDGLLPAAQGNVVAPNFKNKRVNALKGKWIWTAIHSSARNHNDPVFFHWIKADHSYSDYPYASFNVKFDTFEYTDAEYESVLSHDLNWSRADTDELVSTCHRYDMRWAIIADRIELGAYHSVEDMQERYYYVRAALRSKRGDPAAGSSAGSEEVVTGYDAARERKRRRAQDMVFKKTKEDEQEELQLREELKLIDAAIKKNKKMKLAPPPQETATGSANTAQSATTKAGTAEPLPVAAVVGAGSSLVSRSILAPAAEVAGVGGKGASATVAVTTSAATGPAPGKPALQSSRLYSGIVPPVNLVGAVGDIGITKLDLGPGGASLSKKMLLKMVLYLRELDVPETPLATRAVCDLVDAVKQNTVTLLSLHNVIAKKEKELAQLLAANTGGGSSATEATAGTKGKSTSRAQGGKSGAVQADSVGNLSENADVFDTVKVEPGAGASDSFAMDVDE